MNTPRRISIALIVAVSLGIVTAVVLTFFTIYKYRADRDRQMAELHAEHEILANQCAAALTLPVWNFDRASIEKIIDSGMQDRDTAAIVLTFADTKRSVMGRARDVNWKSIPVAAEPSPEGLIVATRSIVVSDETIGSLKIFTTPKFTKETLVASSRLWIYDTVIINLVLILSLFLLLWRLVLLPVRILETHAAAVTAGESADAAPDGVHFRGELETLRESLDKMIHLLNARHVSLREMAARIMQIQDEERRKISRDLHDSTGQVFAALQINLGILSRAAQSGPNSDTKRNELIEECIDLASKCSNEIRTASYLLHPPLLDEVGLSSALKWYADGFAKRSNIAVTLNLPDSAERLNPDVELSLFRVVQESLTNIHRHSGSATASITLRTEPNQISLEIADQGRGIAAEEVRHFHEGSSTLGVGLAGMRQRIQQLGGDVRIESSPNGSTIRVRLPRGTASKPTRR